MIPDWFNICYQYPNPNPNPTRPDNFFQYPNPTRPEVEKPYPSAPVNVAHQKWPKLKKWPKFKNDQNARSNGTAWAPKARRPTFGRLCIRPTILPFLCSCPFLVSMFAVALCVLWVLCGPSKATMRCYTCICDYGLIYPILAIWGYFEPFWGPPMAMS